MPNYWLEHLRVERFLPRNPDAEALPLHQVDIHLCQIASNRSHLWVAQAVRSDH